MCDNANCYSPSRHIIKHPPGRTTPLYSLQSSGPSHELGAVPKGVFVEAAGHHSDVARAGAAEVGVGIIEAAAEAEVARAAAAGVGVEVLGLAAAETGVGILEVVTTAAEAAFARAAAAAAAAAEAGVGIVEATAAEAGVEAVSTSAEAGVEVVSTAAEAGVEAVLTAAEVGVEAASTAAEAGVEAVSTAAEPEFARAGDLIPAFRVSFQFCRKSFVCDELAAQYHVSHWQQSHWRHYYFAETLSVFCFSKKRDNQSNLLSLSMYVSLLPSSTLFVLAS